MKRAIFCRTIFGIAVAAVGISSATAQKYGGINYRQQSEGPPSGSVHEESSTQTLEGFAPVFNNLVVFDELKPINGPDTIVPDLAKEWSWNEDHTELTFKLHEGVKWHDGKPFTSKDVKCTWDTLTGKRDAGWRKNPRKAWWENLKEVRIDGPHQATFVLARPQPSVLSFLASNFSPVYPCHVDGRVMRTKPIGTGPFKVVHFKANNEIRLEKNADYFKKGKPYLDGIVIQLGVGVSTMRLAFSAGKIDNLNATATVLKTIKDAVPDAQCVVRSHNSQGILFMNRKIAPFNNEKLRQAVVLAVDKKAVSDALTSGMSTVGGTMLPPPNGVWGLDADQLKDIPGYGDVEKGREEARALMTAAGYGPDKPLRVEIVTRETPSYRDAAILVGDQLRQIYIESNVKILDVSTWYSTLRGRKFAFAVAVNGIGADDPDAVFYEAVTCGSPRNYAGYCNPELDKMIDAQSRTIDQKEREKLVHEIDRKLQQDFGRPVLYHNASAYCTQSYVKNLVPSRNTTYNNRRAENIWLDK